MADTNIEGLAIDKTQKDKNIEGFCKDCQKDKNVDDGYVTASCGCDFYCFSKRIDELEKDDDEDGEFNIVDIFVPSSTEELDYRTFSFLRCGLGLPKLPTLDIPLSEYLPSNLILEFEVFRNKRIFKGEYEILDGENYDERIVENNGEFYYAEIDVYDDGFLFFKDISANIIYFWYGGDFFCNTLDGNLYEWGGEVPRLSYQKIYFENNTMLSEYYPKMNNTSERRGVENNINIIEE